MKKVLFIDRDGTLVIEPSIDLQLDSLEKLEFYPLVFQYLSRIAQELNYELVMVSNQDGLGTSSFPEAKFLPAHNKILKYFENENIIFAEIHIDKSMPEENAATRKPRTGMLTKYLKGDYDLKNSYVIGDRLTDIQLAKNLQAQGIFFSNENVKDKALQNQISLQTTEWKKIYEYLKRKNRYAKIRRTTRETDITVELSIDGSGKTNINTGMDFFNHMLEQLGKHSGIDLYIYAEGDLNVDEHHTIEDTAITLGETFRKALGNKIGMERYGFCLPMDDCLAQVSIDFGGRNWIEWKAGFKREKIGELATEMFFHFFKSFSDAAKCNLNIKAEGNNEHHKIEAIFKCLARAIKMAIRIDEKNKTTPSTKGIL